MILINKTEIPFRSVTASIKCNFLQFWIFLKNFVILEIFENLSDCEIFILPIFLKNFRNYVLRILQFNKIGDFCNFEFFAKFLQFQQGDFLQFWNFLKNFCNFSKFWKFLKFCKWKISTICVNWGFFFIFVIL